MQKRWLIKTPHDSTLVDQLRSEIKTDRIISELLLQRGIQNFDAANAFFNPDLHELHDPFLMKNMDFAVERLTEAINNNQRILLYGDYDVDGTTAVATLYTYLKPLVKHLDYYIPDRYREGYGLSRLGIEYANEHNFDLIITLDCGIKSIDEVKYANEMGIDMIICDHHTPGQDLPEAIILNPKQKDCSYPFKELSGCGVGYKLLQAYNNVNSASEDIYDLLDFVAISIGADIVSVTGENRILAFHGLKRLNASPRPAFKKLIELAGRTFPVTLTDVVFTIAPRINAAGRLRSGRYAVELMITEDENLLGAIAKEINNDNEERRNLDQSMTEEALEIIEQRGDVENSYSTVVFKDDWHKGVVGIVASRLIETHYKPTIVLTESNGKVTGSARSISGFDIYSAIESCSHLLDQFGGHTHAAGLTLAIENLEQFRDEFESVVQSALPKELLTPEQKIDIELNFDEIFTPMENRLKVPRLKRILSRFEPHGPGNMSPVFISKNVYSTDVRVLKDKHLKLSVTQPDHDVVIDAIGFNLADKIDEVSSGIPFDLVYTIDINRWRDRETIQLRIKDIRESV